MKKRIRVACWFGASAALAAFAACSGTTEPTVAPDAAAAPAPTPPPAPSPTGSTPPTTPPADAGDSAPPRDATSGDAALDAADGALGVDAMDAADGYDGAPLPGSVETVADIPGLTDFDFVGDHLVYRNGGPAPDFKHCTLPACADESTLLPPGSLTPMNQWWALGDDERVHYTDRPIQIGLPFDGAPPLYSAVGSGGYVNSLLAFHGGEQGVLLSTWTEQCGSWKPPGSPHSVPIYCDRVGVVPTGGANTARVARARDLYHSNKGGAVAYYLPSPPSFTGVSAPVPATPPTLVAISAAGPTVPHPTVVVLRAGNVEACPLATPCLAWLNLGALGTILNLDDQHLYIGTPTGLSRCALAEIGTAGTCTLVPHGPVEAVEEPLYLTTTHAWYRSGTQVRRVLK